MTDLEKLQHQAIVCACDMLAAGMMRKKTTYLETMDLIRKSIKQFDNKIHGCSTGLHSGLCTCKPPTLGYSRPGGFKEYVPVNKRKQEDKQNGNS